MAPAVPAFGYRQFAPEELCVAPVGDASALESGELELVAGGARGLRATLGAGPLLTLSGVRDVPPLAVDLKLGGTREGQRCELFEGLEWTSCAGGRGSLAGNSARGDAFELSLAWHPVHDALELRLRASHAERWDPGMNRGLALDLEFDGGVLGLEHDHPFAITSVEARATRPRKYPSGDWMTSEQWFEEVAGPFTSLRLVDARLAQGRLLLVHDGSPSWQRTAAGLRVLLNVVDPWDEEYWQDRLEARLWLLPHRGLERGARMRIAEELLAEPLEAALPVRPGGLACVGGGALDPSAAALPSSAGGVVVRGGALASAWRRCDGREGEGLSEWAGHVMSAPHALRLVEYDGCDSRVELFLPGPIAQAWRTNLLGEKLEQLEVHECTRAMSRELPEPPAGARWQRILAALHPHGILTLMIDSLPGRKQPRDLDARRAVWAAAHRDRSPGEGRDS